MDPNKTKLIDAEGVETSFPLPDLKKGDPIPLVLIKPGRVSAGVVPSKVYAIDSGEVAKRFWQEPVYREVTALYI